MYISPSLTTFSTTPYRVVGVQAHVPFTRDITRSNAIFMMYDVAYIVLVDERKQNETKKKN